MCVQGVVIRAIILGFGESFFFGKDYMTALDDK